ncbi:hypothetical protein Ahy_A10g047629 [Arachis hypogaea]|uniref:Protein FAR1-RELATED SEQUENCE n=1 Tax=Arachis hypogaea TaxID=3818 RepID=A0A445B315_ARAHY|nr:hypothetical protein Ahy_A10g047629 [Arachis hypogaea]
MKKDVRNYFSRKICNVMEEMDVREMLKYFTGMKDMNSDFYFDVEVDQNKCLKTIFWADARSKAVYEYFGDVVLKRYILEHWSKLVKRRHNDIKDSHDPSLLNPKTERFDDLYSNLNNVAQFATQSKETSDILHRYLDMAMAECQKHVGNSLSNANELDNLLTLEDGDKYSGKDALSIFVRGCTINIQDIESPPYMHVH